MKKWRHLQKTDGKILFTNEKDMSKEKERGCLKKKCIGRLLVFFFIWLSCLCMQKTITVLAEESNVVYTASGVENGTLPVVSETENRNITAVIKEMGTYTINTVASIDTGTINTTEDTYPYGKTSGADELWDTDILTEFDFSDLDAFLQKQEISTEGTDFSTFLKELIQSGGQVDKKWFFGQIVDMSACELKENRQIFVQILLLCLAFGILHNFAGAFQNSQIHTVCFSLFYLALIMLLMKSYLIMHQLLNGVMEELSGFMQALLPSFCLALTFSSAITTAAGFYQIVITAIYLVERLVADILVPAIHVFVVLKMIDHMSGKKMISGLTKLLKKCILWVMRMIVAAVAGISLIQSLIAPALDGVKNTAITKMLNMIPGLGAAANGVAGMFLGSAVVIKNGIGTAALIFLLLICIGPVVKMLLLSLCYRLTGAVIQPITDARVCGCIESVGEGAGLLLKILVSVLMMFMVTIAIVTAAVR